MPVMRILLLVSTLLLLSHSVSAPFITVKGKVLLNGLGPANGVTVSVKETKSATLTDTRGNFSINITELPATLIFSYVGHTTIEFKVTDKNASKEIAITLYPTRAAMNEVVVVGYATEKKKSIVGSVSTIRTEPRGAREAEPLIGKLPGLSVEKSVIANNKKLYTAVRRINSW